MPTAQLHSAPDARETARLGMWAFLATELMFFGPLFVGYVHARLAHYDAFVSGSQSTHLWLGTANTALLLTAIRHATGKRPEDSRYQKCH